MRLSLDSSVMRSRSRSTSWAEEGVWPVDSARLRSGSLRSEDARCIMNAADEMGSGKIKMQCEEGIKYSVIWLQAASHNAGIVEVDNGRECIVC